MTNDNSKRPRGSHVPKWIQSLAKILVSISPSLGVSFAARLFTTPIKHKVPKREHAMDRNSLQTILKVPAIDRDIVVYEFGQSDKKVLLVHGWSGRGTQLVKFADKLIQSGYSTVSFDAPAHGKSKGKTTLMPDFIECILEIDRRFGPFTAAIGHSLGGMSLLNATKSGFTVNRLVIIGSGDIVSDIMDDFIKKLGLDKKYGKLVSEHFERRSNQSMDSYSAYLAAREIDFPVFVVHDENDFEVPVKCGLHIHTNLKHGELKITHGLGHRKILGDADVLKATMQFIKN